MAEPYAFPPDEEFDYVEDWEEAVEATQPGGGGSFSAASQEATVVGYVPGPKLRSALRHFLGHSYVSTAEPPDVGGTLPEGTAPTGSTFLLVREPPDRHPLHPQLYCYDATYVGMGPSAAASTPLYQTSEFPGWYGQELYRTDYEKYLVTLRYKSFGRVLFLPDDEMGGYSPRYAYEWLRYTQITIGPAIQALTADGSSNLTFVEGAPSLTTPRTAFPAAIAELMAKSNFTLKWHGVPHEYLSDNQYYLYPTKVIGLLGRINDADFVGLAKGTCLLTAAQFDPVLYPVTPADPYQPLTGWDVTFSFEHFDPEKGVPASEYRGHRLFPYRIDGKWYHAVRGDNLNELLPLADMYGLFQHWADPS